MSEFSKALNERFQLQEEYLGINKPINKITPLVSITIATYQHRDYIKQCLDGVLMQETSFPYEIIIGEDGSVDGTQEICIEYAKKHPNKIRLFIRDRKLSQFTDSDGSIRRFNGIWNRMSSRGKYIAWCEGDDYWIDSLKLQKQVDILENNCNIGLCYTGAKVFNQNKQTFTNTLISPYTNFESLLIQNPITTLTVLFRKSFIDSYNKVINPDDKGWLMGDYPLWLWIASQSQIHFSEDITAVYRHLENSASHHTDLKKQEHFNSSIRDIRLFFQKMFLPNYNMEDIFNNDFFRRNALAGITSNNRIYCLSNIKQVKNKNWKDRLKQILSYNQIGFSILRLLIMKKL